MKRPPAYAPHSRLSAPARSRPEGWRLALGMILLFVAGYGIMSAYWTLVQMLAGTNAPDVLAQANNGDTPMGLLILLFSFVAIALALALTVEQVHKRSFFSLIGEPALAFRQFRTVALPLAGITGVIALVTSINPDTRPAPNLAFDTWLLLLPLSLIAIAVQAGTEEIVFRGYFQQHFAALSGDPRVWIGLPSVMFALGHYTPEAGQNALFLCIWAGAFGLAMADLTARAGTLGPALAVHFVNNTGAILVTSYAGDLSGLALFTLPMSLSETAPMRHALLLDAFVLLISWLTARIALKR